jgi:hypothetical protein
MGRVSTFYIFLSVGKFFKTISLGALAPDKPGQVLQAL